MASAPAATRGRTSTRTSNRGWARRSSTAKNATAPAMPPAAAKSTAGVVQPASTPSISANTTPVNASVESAAPARSSGGAPGRRDSGSQRSPSGAASSTNGTLTRNTQRQPATSTSTPPTTGPRASPSPATPDQTPNALGRSSGGKSTASSDSAGGSAQAAATPISTRAAITSPTVCDAAVSTDAAAKPTNPDTNTRRRPNRSASPLPTSSRPASETRNASITHCSSPMPASRSFDMSGSATLTIVMSIALMNIATQMTPRPHHPLASTASAAEGAGAKWMKCGTSIAAYLASGRSRAHATASANSAPRPLRSPANLTKAAPHAAASARHAAPTTASSRASGAPPSAQSAA